LFLNQKHSKSGANANTQRRPDLVDEFRQVASYVLCILTASSGAKSPLTWYKRRPKYELVVNLKAAKALGLTIPPAILARAAEVIE
jgi:putative tryptophan/tyrosine transport system substrate-binding protein